MATRGAAGQRFACDEGRYHLPTFLRPGYCEAIRGVTDRDRDVTGGLLGDKDHPQRAAEVALFDARETFQRWTAEEGQLYRRVNDALLSDSLPALREHGPMIHSLCHHIREMREGGLAERGPEATLFRGLRATPVMVKEYEEGAQFLWPTVTCTSKERAVAEKFGNYTFVIRVPGEGVSHYADIEHLSAFPGEREVVFYPYSGFEVTRVVRDGRVIELRSVGTPRVVQNARRSLIMGDLHIHDRGRDISVRIVRNDPMLYWGSGKDPKKWFLIAGNREGYWDSPHRFHHRQGYFVRSAEHEGKWEEWQQGKLYCRFDTLAEGGGSK